MLQKHERHTAMEGFTLIELSIVLVIIGLIIGAILVGKSLIHTSEIRAQVSQFQKYTSAVNTFRTKYNALPGDITPTLAAGFGLAARAGSVGQGDGNGFIEGGGPGSSDVAGETALFWNDLSTANLIEGHLAGTDCTVNTGTCASLPTQQIVPVSKLQYQTEILVYSGGDGLNYYGLWSLIQGIGGIDTNGAIHGLTMGYITPMDAYSIDTKIDDGYPLSGTVEITNGITSLNSAPPLIAPAAPAPGVCVSNVPATGSYNIAGSANADSYAGCAMRVRIN